MSSYNESRKRTKSDDPFKTPKRVSEDTSSIEHLEMVCQKRQLKLPTFSILEEIKGGKSDFYEVAVTIGSIRTIGSGDTFTAAKNSGAKAMIRKMKAMNSDDFNRHAAIENYDSPFKERYEVLNLKL